MSDIVRKEDLPSKISTLIEQARRKVAQTINQEMVLLYWNIGKTISPITAWRIGGAKS